MGAFDVGIVWSPRSRSTMPSDEDQQNTSYLSSSHVPPKTTKTTAASCYSESERYITKKYPILMQAFTTRQNLFLRNLKKAVHSFFPLEDIANRVRFKINPIDEPEKPSTSTDDVMRLWTFKNIDFASRLFSAEEVVKYLTAPPDKFPLWIKVKLSNDGTVELLTSKRFRPFKELLHQGTGHPPFKIYE
jgi:hypothetical protein